jgi:hypothetical protein
VVQQIVYEMYWSTDWPIVDRSFHRVSRSFDPSEKLG